jgi:hypothetical protein
MIRRRVQTEPKEKRKAAHDKGESSDGSGASQQKE